MLALAGIACVERGGTDDHAPSRGAAALPDDSVRVATTDGSADGWCSSIPRAANRTLKRVAAASDWFDVYRVDPDVYALVEARQFEEAISYLVIGQTGALLFDTGLGLVPIRPVVESLTSLPVRVLNSHTHFDHVGGNSEFDQVLALDTPYTRANQRVFSHAEIAGEVAPASFCGTAPAGLDTAGFHTRAWSAGRHVADGDTIDLGGRVLEVLHVPGHTPDAVALLDRSHGMLWTGDSYYDAPVWLYVPETDLDAYERSIARLVGLAPSVTRLLTSHNTAVADPARLAEMQSAIRAVREGRVVGEPDGGNRLLFRFDHFAILTSPSVLRGGGRATTGGGSGLTTSP